MKCRLLLFVVFAVCAVIVGCTQSTLPSTNTSQMTSANEGGKFCTTKECFLPLANDCNEANIIINETAGIFSYTAKDCVLTKTLVKLNPVETQEMKTILEGKSLTCDYKRGQFDARWTTELLFGTDNCTGPLKDALAKLIPFV